MLKPIRPWKRRMMNLTAVALATVMITSQAGGQSPDGQSTGESSVPRVQGTTVAQSESLPIPPQDEPAPSQTAEGPRVAGASGCACGAVCVYNPCIKYLGEHRLKRFCCGCKCPTFEKISMRVEDPARCGCAVEIPICVPTCCTGEPCVKSRCGVFGAGVVWMKWCCGYKVRVLFAGNNECVGRKVIVSYFGK